MLSTQQYIVCAICAIIIGIALIVLVVEKYIDTTISSVNVVLILLGIISTCVGAGYFAPMAYRVYKAPYEPAAQKANTLEPYEMYGHAGDVAEPSTTTGNNHSGRNPAVGSHEK